MTNLITMPIKQNYSEISESIKSSSLYQEEGVEITELKNKKVFKESNIDVNDQLFGKITHKESNTIFNGCLNSNLERNLYGINEYQSGNIYLGHYIYNTKTGKGCFIVKPITEGKGKKSTVSYELYNGSFNGDKKHGLGTYTKMTEPLKNNEIDSCDLDAFIGLFDNDKRHRGLYLEKIKDNFFAYYGNFLNGIKHDSKALVYDNVNDRVLRARYENGIPVYGYVVEFKDETHTETTYVKFDTTGKLTNTILEDNIDRETVRKINEECKSFRSILFDDDCFGKCYTNAKDILKSYIKIKDSDLNSEDGYNNLVELLHNSSEQDAFKSVYKHLG